MASTSPSPSPSPRAQSDPHMHEDLLQYTLPDFWERQGERAADVSRAGAALLLLLLAPAALEQVPLAEFDPENSGRLRAVMCACLALCLPVAIDLWMDYWTAFSAYHYIRLGQLASVLSSSLVADLFAEVLKSPALMGLCMSMGACFEACLALLTLALLDTRGVWTLLRALQLAGLMLAWLGLRAVYEPLGDCVMAVLVLLLVLTARGWRRGTPLPSDDDWVRFNDLYANMVLHALALVGVGAAVALLGTRRGSINRAAALLLLRAIACYCLAIPPARLQWVVRVRGQYIRYLESER